jgi:hypothetical protein
MKIEGVTLDHLYEFLERGSMENAPQKMVDYVVMLEKVRGMLLRFDIYGNDDGVVRHLIKFEKLSPYKARQICSEAREYFYVDRTISKNAWKNILAEQMQKTVNMAIMMIKDVSDAKKVVDMLKEIGAMREVHVPDKEELPEGFFDKPINLMTLDASIFEFGQASRVGLEKFIDSLPGLTEKEISRIKQEALLLPLTIFPNEQENPRQT